MPRLLVNSMEWRAKRTTSSTTGVIIGDTPPNYRINLTARAVAPLAKVASDAPGRPAGHAERQATKEAEHVEGPRLRWLKVTGILLVVVGCAGLGTVADDLRHIGELFGVAGILMIGLVLVAAESDHPMTRRLALHWVAVGIGVGVLIGAGIDSMPVCVAGGSVLGALGSAISSIGRP